MQSSIEWIIALGVGGTLGSSVTLILRNHLSRLHERERQRRATDLATYQDRMTRIIAANLCALIRSDRCRDGEREELEELVQNLSGGLQMKRFLDPVVQRHWERLVKKTAEYGWKRLTEVITEQEIADYTRAWENWLLAARESFGPLPEMDRPILRGATRKIDVLDQAA